MIVLLLLLFFPISCKLQTSHDPASGSQQLKHLKAVVAVTFYPSGKAELISLLDRLMAQAKPGKIKEEVLAVLVPHAGYVFSGVVAASSFNQIPKDMEFDNIFVIGSSHHTQFDGASIYSQGHYITPLLWFLS